MKRKMNWIPLLDKDSLETLKKYEFVLVFMDSDEYPYDIVQYGKPSQEEGIEEYWHSYLCINSNKYQYSNEELLEMFSHYFLLIRAIPKDTL